MVLAARGDVLCVGGGSGQCSKTRMVPYPTCHAPRIQPWHGVSHLWCSRACAFLLCASSIWRIFHLPRHARNVHLPTLCKRKDSLHQTHRMPWTSKESHRDDASGGRHVCAQAHRVHLQFPSPRQRTEARPWNSKADLLSSNLKFSFFLNFSKICSIN